MQRGERSESRGQRPQHELRQQKPAKPQGKTWSCIHTAPALLPAPPAPLTRDSTFKLHPQISHKALKMNYRGEMERGRQTDRPASTSAVGATPKHQEWGEWGSRGNRGWNYTEEQGLKPQHGACTWRSPHRGRSVLLWRVFREVPSSLGRALCKLDMAAVFFRSMTA